MKKQNKQLSHQHSFRVRFSETDPLGIVWHGYYIGYFEEGREAFGRKYGISYLNIKEQGFITPIVKSICEHKLPLRYGDLVQISTTLVVVQAAKMIFKYVISNSDGAIVCTGETTQVFVDFKGDLSLTNPPFYQDWKKKWRLTD